MKFLQTWVKIRWLFGGKFQPILSLINANASAHRGKSFNAKEHHHNSKDKRIFPRWVLYFTSSRSDISSIFARFIDFWTLLGMESFHRWCQLKLWKKTVDKTSSKRFKRFHEGFQEEKVGISKIFLQHKL